MSSLSYFATWTPIDAVSFHAEAIFVGDLFASSVPTGTVVLDGWQRVDVAVRWAITETVEVSLGVRNLFDQEYEEAPGFPTLGARPSLGIRFRM